MTDKEVMQMALDALDEATTYTSSPTWSPSMTEECKAAAEALRTRLAQPWQELVERGSWRAAFDKDAPKTVFVESDDFTHDARLYVDGDFADEGQRLQYAQQVARMLNDFKLPTGEQTWQGLTDEEIKAIAATPVAVPGSYVHSFARAIEAKLKEKNT